MKILVIGCGDVGYTLIERLIDENHSVTLVESDPDKAKEIAEKTNAFVIKGDGTDLRILKDAGIEEADAVIAVTHDDKANLMSSEIAKSMKKEVIIAKVNNLENEALFSKLEVPFTVPQVSLAVNKIMEIVQGQEAEILTHIEAADMEIIKVRLKHGNTYIGKKPNISQTEILLVARDAAAVPPSKVDYLKENDELIIAVPTKKVRSFIKRFKK